MRPKHKMLSHLKYAGVLAAAISAVILTPVSGAEQSRTVINRITESQYANIIADVFGSDIDLGGRFEPGMRQDGLLAVGSSRVSVTASGMEQYDAMAHAIASTVVDDAHREMLVPCTPAAADKPDDACAETFFSEAGLLLYRRPLTASQLDAYVAAAHIGTEQAGDFYEGLSLSLAGMLSSPMFLFREQRTEPDPDRTGQLRLDAYSKAAQLSFFLWDSGPDAQLLEVAASGAIHTDEGLKRQVDRMLASPRLESGLRAFFSDNFRFSEFGTLIKDTIIFPKFDPAVAEQAREQTMRTVLDVVMKQNADYRDIFTTKRTFLTPELGSIYNVPVFKSGPNGSPDQWQPYEFSEEDPFTGILTQISFTALHSPAGRSSPTFRGKALREIMMCQEVPAPPGDVDFTLFESGKDLRNATARERLALHSAEPMCAGCHKITDPLGLALENFDGLGEFRTHDNGALIDASGQLNGSGFDGADDFADVVRDDPAITSCLVERMSSYAVGRSAKDDKKDWIKGLNADFAQTGFRIIGLMRAIALSDDLYTLSNAEISTAAAK